MFSGSLVALITPFDGDGVDEAALRRLVNWHVAQGTNALVPCGTTGEESTLTRDESQHVIEVVVQEAAGRIPVIAGAGSNNPRTAIANTLQAQRMGADAALHVAGYYNRPDQEGLYRHFEMIASQTDLPLLVYNIPPRAVVDISPETMARIAALPAVVGVKDATRDLSRPILERLRIRHPFCQLSGEDITAVAFNAAGGAGCISVTANVAPALCARLQAACREGDYALAMALQDRLAPLHEALFLNASPAGVKYACSRLGHCSDDCRAPIGPLSQAAREQINCALDQLALVA